MPWQKFDLFDKVACQGRARKIGAEVERMHLKPHSVTIEDLVPRSTSCENWRRRRTSPLCIVRRKRCTAAGMLWPAAH